MSAEILIYSTITSERFIYTCQVIFKYILQAPFSVTYNQADFINAENTIKLNYSSHSIDANCLQIMPWDNFIYEDRLRPVIPEVVYYNNLPVIFTSSQEEIPFDIFSAVFFMVSRFEEYFPSEKDIYGRFQEKNSLTGKYDLTKTPIVDGWCHFLKSAIEKKFNTILPATAYKITYTFDIDVAYAFKGRSVLRNIFSLGKDFARLNLRNIFSKLNFVTGKIKDPFDTYDFINSAKSIDKKFFFLLAKEKQGYNHNLNPQSGTLEKLIKKIAATYNTGIHPSYYTPTDKALLGQEINTLKNIINLPVNISRQHYLRLSFPETYQNLANAGIQYDYTLMYAEQPGFRAGTSYAFPFFNVLTNKMTGLMIQPSCVMDSMFRDDLKIPATESITTYLAVLQEVKKYGGNMVCIWHNDLLADQQDLNHPLNFRKIYIDFYKAM